MSLGKGCKDEGRQGGQQGVVGLSTQLETPEVRAA